MGRLRKNPIYETKLFNDTDYYVKDPINYKGKWNQLFNNSNPIEIEIGSGKGNFIVSKAILFPNINFIAIDKFPTVLYKVLKKINDYNSKNEVKLNNIKIIVIDAKQIEDYFAENEVSKCYLNFSDPWPKKNHEKNRLTHIDFLKKYDFITKPNANIEFKSDNESLYEYTKLVLLKNKYKIIFDTNDLYSDKNNLLDNVQTEYEIKWFDKGAKIKKIIFETK